MKAIRKTFWYLTGLLFFSIGIGLCIDLGMFFIDENATWTARLQGYFQGSAISFRSFLMGLFVGMLITHVTKWGKSPDQTPKTAGQE
jgi:hypothetical protein